MTEHDALGRMILNIGCPAFDGAFFELCRRTLDISSCSAFCFEDSRQPYPVILEGAGPQRRSQTKLLGSDYVEGGFRHDPQFRHLFAVTDIEIRLVQPSDIDDPSFRDHYYDAPEIGSEITILAHHRAKWFNVGFYRSAEKAAFDSAAIDRAAVLAQVAVPALYRHVELQRADPDQVEAFDLMAGDANPNEQLIEHLSAVLLAEGHKLSPREAEICACIVLGYRTLAMSLKLGISENTICTHRKRAYAKLNITSQNELFSRYFRTVTRLSRGTDRRDPLPMTQLAA